MPDPDYSNCRQLPRDQAQDLKEQLEHLQFRDIALLRAYALRDKDNPDLKAFTAAINARGAILRSLQPNEKVTFEVNSLTQVNSKSETKTMVDLSKMSEDDRKALLRAEEILTQAETAVDR